MYIFLRIWLIVIIVFFIMGLFFGIYNVIKNKDASMADIIIEPLSFVVVGFLLPFVLAAMLMALMMLLVYGFGYILYVLFIKWLIH